MDAEIRRCVKQALIYALVIKDAPTVSEFKRRTQLMRKLTTALEV